MSNDNVLDLIDVEDSSMSSSLSSLSTMSSDDGAVRKKARVSHSSQRSKWWDHFDLVTVGQQMYAQCKYCSQRYIKDGTGNMANHIQRSHDSKIQQDNKQPAVSFPKQREFKV